MDIIFKKLNRYFYGKWHIAVLDLERGRWIKDANSRYIPYLKAENANGRHILIQPLKPISCFYLLIDDIDQSIILRHHMDKNGAWKPGRMVVETSPSNYQVWIHSSNALSINDKKYWLQRLASDPGAHPNNRWGRCPGFRNRKEIYRDVYGRYPLSRLIWIDWKNFANIPKPFSHQPWRGVCLNSNLSRVDYIKKDQSATDFSYALALIRRGYTDAQIEKQIKMERLYFKNHSGEKRMAHYLKITIQRAREMINKESHND